MHHLLVETEYLDRLAAKADSLATELARCSSRIDWRISSSATVSDGYGEFGNKWDQRRSELAEGLEAVGSQMRSVASAFRSADNDLANQLNASDA